MALITVATLVFNSSMVVIDLLTDEASEAKEVLASFTPALTKEAYIKKLDGYFTKGEEHEEL